MVTRKSESNTKVAPASTLNSRQRRSVEQALQLVAAVAEGPDAVARLPLGS
jgi:hypothetical protein